jgi:hypothetical protein
MSVEPGFVDCQEACVLKLMTWFQHFTGLTSNLAIYIAILCSVQVDNQLKVNMRARMKKKTGIWEVFMSERKPGSFDTTNQFRLVWNF